VHNPHFVNPVAIKSPRAKRGQAAGMAEQENYLDDICIRSPIVEIRKKADNQSRKAGEGMGITDDMAC
jgi:hypothetical protein